MFFLFYPGTGGWFFRAFRIRMQGGAEVFSAHAMSERMQGAHWCKNGAQARAAVPTWSNCKLIQYARVCDS